MSVEILYDSDQNRACFACSTSGIVFGPLVKPAETWPTQLYDAREVAEAFHQFAQTAGINIRTVGAEQLASTYSAFRNEQLLDEDTMEKLLGRWVEPEAGEG